jgi:Ca2+-binding RTX toxin-like protein
MLNPIDGARTLNPSPDDTWGLHLVDVNIALGNLVELAGAQTRCGGQEATQVGTSGADQIEGTSRPDVIAGLGGRDSIKGLRGNDVLCGGPGRDRLRGGRGKDRLLGGKGRDRCVGGAGADRARRCEKLSGV